MAILRNIAISMLVLASGCFEKPVDNNVRAKTQSDGGKTQYSSNANAGDSDGDGSTQVPDDGTPGAKSAASNSASSSTTTSPGTTAQPKGSSFQVPETSSLVFGPLGLTAGGYQKTISAVYPNICTRGNLVKTTGALFPFNENQTLVVRGPAAINQFALYARGAKGSWDKTADLSALSFLENSYGTEKGVNAPFAGDKTLENGREIYAKLPSAGELLLVMKVKLPHAADPVYSAVAQDDVPAIWLLNSEIFAKPSAQYYCNCRGEGANGGCGEIDIAEVIPENKDQITSTLYSYEGARGGILPTTRPTSSYQVYALLLRSDGSKGNAWIMEANGFDFSATSIPDTAVASEWLPRVKHLNQGSEALNPP